MGKHHKLIDQGFLPYGTQAALKAAHQRYGSGPAARPFRVFSDRAAARAITGKSWLMQQCTKGTVLKCNAGSVFTVA
jgi:ferric-dicitrate binding protein FerR (iron transport regulator)